MLGKFIMNRTIAAFVSKDASEKLRSKSMYQFHKSYGREEACSEACTLNLNNYLSKLTKKHNKAQKQYFRETITKFVKTKICQNDV